MQSVRIFRFKTCRVSLTTRIKTSLSYIINYGVVYGNVHESTNYQVSELFLIYYDSCIRCTVI